MKNYISSFEPSRFQVVYVPRNEDWSYSKLYLNLNKRYLSFFNSKNVIASAIAWFLFLQQVFFMAIWILIIFFILSHNKKWAKRLHLLIPIIVYSKMEDSEVRAFLKRNPQLAKPDTDKIIPNSKIVETYVDDQSDNIMSKIGWKNNSQTLKELIAAEEKENNTTASTKSIFDDYESVMDKFNKK